MSTVSRGPEPLAPDLCTPAIIASFSVNLTSSMLPSPERRCVKTTLSRCLPLAQYIHRLGDALSIDLLIVRWLTSALPPDKPEPENETGWVTPNVHDSTSISSLCLSWADSPLMPSINK